MALLPTLALAATSGFPLHSGSATAATPLRVCADPDNFPFSNAHGEGFENQLAVLFARALGRPLTYTWHKEGADFVRSTLDARLCDVIMAMPTPAAGVATTQPYYWSSYVLVTRSDRPLDIVSLDDHRLRTLKIGVEAIAGNALYTPPARLLAEDGLAGNLVAFAPHAGGMSVPDPDPRMRLIHAVASGKIDVAAVWGPAVGYWTRQSGVSLRVRPIGDTSEFSSRKTHFGLQAMQYEIAMAVRPADQALRLQLDQAIHQNQRQIRQVLEHFAIPLVDPDQLDRPALARVE
jgi:quinoprotein dehydrogenase-associated probable ABC transporter substrate-binding protein